MVAKHPHFHSATTKKLSECDCVIESEWVTDSESEKERRFSHCNDKDANWVWDRELVSGRKLKWKGKERNLISVLDLDAMTKKLSECVWKREWVSDIKWEWKGEERY